MQTLNLVCIGRLKESYLREACAEYQKRLSAFCKLNLIELPEYRLPAEPGSAEIARGIAAEGREIRAKCSGYQIPLCIEGKQLSSEELAETFRRLALEGRSEISLIIGGSYGLAEEVKAAAGLKLSLSRMTFPHQLARVLLLEQVYRAFQINSNGKYHK